MHIEAAVIPFDLVDGNVIAAPAEKVLHGAPIPEEHGNGS